MQKCFAFDWLVNRRGSCCYSRRCVIQDFPDYGNREGIARDVVVEVVGNQVFIEGHKNDGS